MTVSMQSPDSIPRTFEGCKTVPPSVRFLMMNQIKAFTCEEDKQAFASADKNSEQPQRLLEALLKYDKSRGIKPEEKKAAPPPQEAAPPPQAAKAPPKQLGLPNIAPSPNALKLPGAPGGISEKSPTPPQEAVEPPKAAAKRTTAKKAPKAAEKPPQAGIESALNTILENQKALSASIEQLAGANAQLVDLIALQDKMNSRHFQILSSLVYVLTRKGVGIEDHEIIGAADQLAVGGLVDVLFANIGSGEESAKK